MKISACLISKTPSEQLERAIASVRPLVDEVVVVLNGAKMERISKIAHATVGIFIGANAPKACPPTRGCGCKAGDLLDFAALRNYSFSLATGDWLFWLDSDDELEFSDKDALRKLASRSGKYRYGFLYDYGGQEIWNVRLVPQKTFPSKWDYPVHEVLITEQFGHEFERSNDLVIHHKRTSEGEKESVARNLRIALHHAGAKRWQGDARFQNYLGQSYRNVGQWDLAIEAYEKCHALSGVPDEKYLAAEWISKLNTDRGNHLAAAEWAHRAIHMWPERANGFLRAGDCYFNLAGATGNNGYWHIAVRYYRMGFGLPVSSSLLPMADPNVFAWEASKNYSLALNRTGDVKEALRVAEKAMEFRADEANRLNIAIYKAYLAKERLVGEAKELSPLFGVSPFADTYVKEAFQEAISLAPSGFRAEGPAIALRSPTKTIAFVCSYQWQPWNPENPPGGSEIAVVELSKRFARRGYDVSVFTDPLEGGPATYNGVRWRGTAYSEDPNEEFDLLIGWRGLDRVEGGKAKRRALWLHDMDVQWSSPKRLSLVDVVVVNSMWHADCVRSALLGKRIEILGAGLDPSRFAFEKWPKSAHRKRHWCVWASSWDRGLDYMLSIWPTVRSAYEERLGRVTKTLPELHVLYGHEGSLNMARQNRDKATEEKFLRWVKLAEETAGVTLHGRVPPAEYDQILMKSGVWAYPIPQDGNKFGETFSVTSAEAICAGLRAVVSPRGALAEVVSPYAFRNIWGKREDARYTVQFAGAIVDAMTEIENGATTYMRETLAEEARARFDWDRVADRWEERILK
jgi:glycosyltransferase involved in cell wall biosynthesis/tetratricopeptide (TPR) repeat protein